MFVNLHGQFEQQSSLKGSSWNLFSPSKHFSNEFYRNCCPLWVVSLVACYCQQPIKREKSRFYSILLWKFRNLPSRDKVMGPWGYKWVTLFSLSVPGVLADCKTIPPQSTHNVHFRLSNVFFPTSCRLWGKRKDFPQFCLTECRGVGHCWCSVDKCSTSFVVLTICAPRPDLLWGVLLMHHVCYCLSGVHDSKWEWFRLEKLCPMWLCQRIVTLLWNISLLFS
jgi:hypothetical protein